jgi:hypothetical protein
VGNGKLSIRKVYMKKIYYALFFLLGAVPLRAMDKANSEHNQTPGPKRPHAQPTQSEKSVQEKLRLQQKQREFKNRYNNYTIGGYIMSMNEKQGEN